jgi:ferrous iron transport protein A
MKLSDIPVGSQGRIKAYAPQSNEPGLKAYRQKCLSMGLTPGVSFKIIGRAPLGCPIEIELRGYSLSLRTQESQVLICELL